MIFKKEYSINYQGTQNLKSIIYVNSNNLIKNNKYKNQKVEINAKLNDS